MDRKNNYNKIYNIKYLVLEMLNLNINIVKKKKHKYATQKEKSVALFFYLEKDYLKKKSSYNNKKKN